MLCRKWSTYISRSKLGQWKYTKMNLFLRVWTTSAIKLGKSKLPLWVFLLLSLLGYLRNISLWDFLLNISLSAVFLGPSWGQLGAPRQISVVEGREGRERAPWKERSWGDRPSWLLVHSPCVTVVSHLCLTDNVRAGNVLQFVLKQLHSVEDKL